MDRRAFNALMVWFASQASRVATAMEPVRESAEGVAAAADGAAPANLATPTLGGMQFWQDELLFHAWRIQRNVFTGHYRLLDDHDWRQAWGTFDECQARLEDSKRERS